ncbi:MAG: serine/threonine-protein kinase [Myxococcota bacterium]
MGEKASRKARAPLQLGRYEVLVPLASGGMGTVYVAAVRGAGGFEREVAIKLIHEHLREEEQFTADLLEEAKLAVQIRHPNVVGVLDTGEEADGVYLVMDYVEGDSLAGLMRRMRKQERTIPAAIGLRILHDALLGLHAAHELRVDGELAGVVHRDFTPQNILVGTDGIARLTDFGVAKAAHRTSHTATGIVKGKLHYMPPEQARAEPIDRRADIWSAGVIAWELLARQRLFTDLNDAAIVLKLVTSLPPPLRTVREEVPGALEKAVQDALSPREERYPTALDFARALEAGAEPLGGLADIDHVASFVRVATKSKIAKRKEKIAEVRALRTHLDSIAEITVQEIPHTPSDFGPARTWTHRTDGAAALVDEASSGVAQGPMSLTPTPRNDPSSSPRKWGVMAVAAAALTLGGGAAVWLTSHRPAPPSTAAADEMALPDVEPTSRSAREVSVPLPEAPAEGSAEVEGKPPRRVAFRSAVVDIADVVVGGQSLPVTPGREVTVEVGPNVREATVVARSGQRVQVNLAAGQVEADVAFPARRPAHLGPVPRAPSPPRPPPPPPPPDDNLAPNPFEN